MVLQMGTLRLKLRSVFEERAFVKASPKLADKEKKSVFMNRIAQYTNFRSMDNFKRVCIAWLVMFFQQWSGVDASKLTCLDIS